MRFIYFLMLSQTLSSFQLPVLDRGYEFYYPTKLSAYGEVCPKIIEYTYANKCLLLADELACGANPSELYDNDWPYYGFTPLGGAIYANCYYCAKLLLEAGAYVKGYFSVPLSFEVSDPKFSREYNARNSHPLAAAICMNVDVRIINILIQYGADINIGHDFLDEPLNRTSLTPLMLAVVMNNKQAFKLLLQAGADPEIRNSIDNLSAQDYARIYDQANLNCHSYEETFSSLLEKYKKGALFNAPLFSVKD